MREYWGCIGSINIILCFASLLHLTIGFIRYASNKTIIHLFSLLAFNWFIRYANDIWVSLLCLFILYVANQETFRGQRMITYTSLTIVDSKHIFCVLEVSYNNKHDYIICLKRFSDLVHVKIYSWKIIIPNW